jgi:hypothetical protein
MLIAYVASTFCKVAILPVCACMFVVGMVGMDTIDNKSSDVRNAVGTIRVLFVIEFLTVTGRIIYKISECCARHCSQWSCHNLEYLSLIWKYNGCAESEEKLEE